MCIDIIAFDRMECSDLMPTRIYVQEHCPELGHLHEYFIEEIAGFEAGWCLKVEVKAMRGSVVQIQESYIIVRDGEIFIIGSRTALPSTASTISAPKPPARASVAR